MPWENAESPEMLSAKNTFPRDGLELLESQCDFGELEKVGLSKGGAAGVLCVDLDETSFSDDKSAALRSDEGLDHAPLPVHAQHVGRGETVDDGGAQPEAGVDDPLSTTPFSGGASEKDARRIGRDDPLEDDGHAHVANPMRREVGERAT